MLSPDWHGIARKGRQNTQSSGGHGVTAGDVVKLPLHTCVSQPTLVAPFTNMDKL